MEIATWSCDSFSPPHIAVSVHSGHEIPDRFAPYLGVPAQHRLIEEDPHTDRLTEIAPVRGVGRLSRFLVDLNRPPAEAIYQNGEDSWGMDVWSEPLPDELRRTLLDLHEGFHRKLQDLIAEMIWHKGRAVVLDLHSYNHRRGGPGSEPADPEANPEVNVGTGSLDRDRWGDVVDTFLEVMRDHGFDARENVRFQGRYVAERVNTAFPDAACCLAIEFKKTFMDEHTGALHPGELERRIEALRASIDPLTAASRKTVDRETEAR